MMTPASPWIGSTKKATVFGVIACLQCPGVAERDDPEARRERPEMIARLAGSVLKPTIAERAAVKIVGADDDLGLRRPARP